MIWVEEAITKGSSPRFQYKLGKHIIEFCYLFKGLLLPSCLMLLSLSNSSEWRKAKQTSGTSISPWIGSVMKQEASRSLLLLLSLLRVSQLTHPFLSVGTSVDFDKDIWPQEYFTGSAISTHALRSLKIIWLEKKTNTGRIHHKFLIHGNIPHSQTISKIPTTPPRAAVLKHSPSLL